MQIEQTLLKIDRKETTLTQSIDLIGKSLREDYNETPKKDLEDAQNDLARQLRVEIDNGLKLVPQPYLPPNLPKEYTLVLDLDETLLHFEGDDLDGHGQLSIRPAADEFLEMMAYYYNLVIFTAGTQEYAEYALSFLGNVKFIGHKLFRQHCLPYNGYYIKDLTRLGTDLSKTLIVDNISENY